MSNMIKLANGREVTLDEFLTWNGYKQRARLNPNKHSDEARAKISDANKGRTMSAEARAKIGAAHKGKTVSAEARAKLSAALKGRIITAEARAKLSAAGKGRTHSAEHRAKIRAARTKPVMTPNGLYPSRKHVAEEAKVNITTIDNWMKKWPDHYYYV